ncbi:FtsQ-type POTRA domain-containing protein [Haematospirillum jordaniae]|nr:FtsQ-type POTRA domain-containing protein [Haematospirillum jordaniae]NKD56812.1 FtsQ-type POTRA domain-containing protein [Haematospirillum jordaniae]NKD59032.1 FtsQ-type POTRA domain-containing protein [Haematospirillum jordaniae]NKD81100.1 FtsQ-type POTRA domain-containing protein [Haematospirillum jordaniae]NKD82810.1 FtsQ-type POTRA domain-containing protein [Haematospirillum jordaniae]
MRHMTMAVPFLVSLPGTRARKLLAAGTMTTALVIAAWMSGAMAWTQNILRDATLDGLMDISADAGIKLRQITVTGRGRTDPDDLLGAVDLPRGAPLLELDPSTVRTRLEQLPWVRLATVERHLPDELHITLVEKTPIALWQNGSDFRMVDADGSVIGPMLPEYSHLPLIAGRGAPDAVSDLLTLLSAEPDIMQRVRAAVRVGSRRWDLWIDAVGEGGTEVKLPEFDTNAALSRLAAMDREQKLLERGLEMIDLRVLDRMIVRAAPTMQTRSTPAGKGRTQPPTLPAAGPARNA